MPTNSLGGHDCEARNLADSDDWTCPECGEGWHHSFADGTEVWLSDACLAVLAATDERVTELIAEFGPKVVDEGGV
jgi:hypothetical protein